MEGKENEISENAKEDCPCEGGKVPNRQGKCVMPEVTFPAFVLSLNTSVLYHLGEIGDPVTGKRAPDFDLARHGIDTLVLLEQKTKGNLLKEEEELLKNILYDVKLRYVNAVKK